MKIILTKQLDEVLVDDDMFDYLNQFSWRTRIGTNTKYALYGKRTNGIYSTFFMHKVILNTNDKNLFIDHIDRNGLNNQKSNLRIVTKSQNLQNTIVSKSKKSSKYKGVFFHIQHQKWQASIYLNGRLNHLGYFNSEIDAAKKYDEIGIKHHGTFFNPNFSL